MSAAMNTPALEAVGVSKRYADRNALDSVDLVALPGQMHGLLGPNGAGKTTLIRLVWDSFERDAGTLRSARLRPGSDGRTTTRRGRRFRRNSSFLSCTCRHERTWRFWHDSMVIADLPGVMSTAH